MVKNESLAETVVPAGTVIGHMYLTDTVTHPSPSKTADAEFDAQQINFGDSPVSEEWKEILQQKLSARSQVFLLHGWDVGVAKGLEHRPFRERSRHLTPADPGDVRKPIQGITEHKCISNILFFT